MSRPNILFVFDDQHRRSALGCYGNSVVRTPNLDRLAQDGMLLEQAVSSYPLCSPYRGALLTGQHPWRHGVVDNEYRILDDGQTLARCLGRAGYHTGFIGKWHLGYGPYGEEKRHGFDMLAGYNCGYGYLENAYHLNEQGPIPFDSWSPAGETDLAIRFLQEHRRERAASPFALFIAWAPPHWPYDQYPERYRSYRPEDVDLPPNVPEPLADHARRELADYYGHIAGLDDQFGRLMDELDRLGLARETIVVFTSDHGDHLWAHGYGRPWDRWLPAHMRGNKGTPWEESVAVPFIVRFPGRVAAGTRSPVLLSTVDIMPTLLGLCGLEAPAGVQGTDLSPALLGKNGPLPDSQYLMNMGVGWPDRTEWMGFWRGVRTERWTYARWLDDARPRMLFDREIAETGDPFETASRDPRTGMALLGQQFASERWTRD